MKKTVRGALYIVMLVFILIDLYMLFHNLGEGFLNSTDEAYHATNAYEMLKGGRWIVNTYRGAVDYFNSKPPFCLDLIILSYKAFGVSAFAARFPSAVAGVLTVLLAVEFLLLVKKDLVSAAFFPGLFASCSAFFSFHMYRAAEMDGWFNLFFVIAMLALIVMSDKPNTMYVYGAALGMAYMCKGPHAALIFIIGLLYIPRIKNAFKSPKRVVVSAFLAAFLPFLWMIKRYLFDGTKFLEALMFGETVKRVAEAEISFWSPIKSLVSSNIMVIFLVLMVTGTVIRAIVLRSFSESVKELGKFFYDNLLYVYWALVPVLFFAVTKSHMPWYTYCSLIAMCFLTASYIGEFSRNEEVVLSNCIIYGLAFVMPFIFILPCVKWDLNLNLTAGHNVNNYTAQMIKFGREYGYKYGGTKAYLVSLLRDDSKQGHWEPKFVAPAEMYCDLVPVDGTVEDFLAENNAILVMDKYYWDEYAPVLSGHVILSENDYLILCSETY